MLTIIAEKLAGRCNTLSMHHAELYAVRMCIAQELAGRCNTLPDGEGDSESEDLEPAERKRACPDASVNRCAPALGRKR